MEKFFKYVVQQFIVNGLINSSDREIYCFGIKSLFIHLLHLLVLISIGVYFDLLWESLCFFAAYMIIRVHAGGYHAPSNSLCFISSTLTDIVAVSVLKYTPQHLLVEFIILTCSIAIPILIKYGSIDSVNKPVSLIEKFKYKNRTNLAVLGVMFCVFLSLFFHGEIIGYSLSIGIFIASMTVLICVIPIE